MIKRRVFLLVLAIIGIGYGILRSWHAFSVFLTGAEKEAGPATGEDRFRRGGHSSVAAVGGTNIKEMVTTAVSLLGGVELLGVGNKSVLVKPNVVGGKSHPTTTNPAVVQAVVEFLFEAGAARVFVGDMSALIRGGTADNMVKTGIAAAARQAGAELLYFEDHGWVRVKVKGRYVEEVLVSEWLFKADRVINLPVIKTHRYAGYSICLKNLVGATHFSQRPYLIDRKHWEEVVAELNLAFRADLHIADGSRVMVKGGPWEGEAIDGNLLLASGDPVACDAVGLGVIKSFGRWPPLDNSSIWQMRQLKRATEIGIGAAKSEEIKLLTKSLDNNPAFEKLMGQVQSLLPLSETS